jgi:hypothetical protein
VTPPADIRSLLGDEAESLLNHKPKGIPAELLNAIQDVYLDGSVTIG